MLGISREQLIDIAILVGTDYNEKMPGIGPKTALKLVKQYGSLEKIEDAKNMKLDFPFKIIITNSIVIIDGINRPDDMARNSQNKKCRSFTK